MFRAQLLKILHIQSMRMKNLFPRREEKLLILASTRSRISLIRNRKRTVKCGCYPYRSIL
uniref:Uncharacterized protein n=1 Tax=Setaria italica TaxID=4555 RepID=K3YF03_SETIT